MREVAVGALVRGQGGQGDRYLWQPGTSASPSLPRFLRRWLGQGQVLWQHRALPQVLGQTLQGGQGQALGGEVGHGTMEVLGKARLEQKRREDTFTFMDRPCDRVSEGSVARLLCCCCWAKRRWAWGRGLLHLWFVPSPG